MRSLILALFWLALAMPFNRLLGQCSVTSTNGYTVTFTLTQSDVLLTPAGPSCNYNVVLNYNIQYSGSNQSNLWSVNGGSDCIPDPDLGYNLPTSGSGSTNTYTATYGGYCNNLTLDCEIKLTVLGPGIPLQTLSGCGNIIYPVPSQAPLPVELTDFKALTDHENIKLAWTTASERNNRGFSVEQSLNGTDWEEIGWKNGMGNSTETNQYNFIYTKPYPNFYYFRLKQLDNDGNFEYSKVINLDFMDKAVESKLLPNPAKDRLNIISLNKEQVKSVQFFNQMGQKVLTVPFSENMDISSLQNGIYMLVMEMENRFLTNRIIVSK